MKTLEQAKASEIQSLEKEKYLKIHSLELDLQKKSLKEHTLGTQIEQLDIDKEELKSRISNKDEEIEAFLTAVNKYEMEVKEKDKLFKESQEQRKRLEEMNNSKCSRFPELIMMRVILVT